MTDRFRDDLNVNAPGASAFAITPDDGTVFDQTTRGIYVGTAGDLTVRMKDGTSVTFANVPAGKLLPLRVDKVLATGTDADDIVGIY